MKILTFDIEEWFHILDNSSTKTEKEWSKYEVRIHHNMERIFNMLEKHEVKATFFILGWIAEKYPRIVHEIDSRGYEIGSHTDRHQLVYEQSPEVFRQDVDRSIKTLEDIIGKKITCFRAPGFSITEKSKWAFEVLYDLGIKTDASIFPAKRAHGGMPTYGISEPSVLEYNGVQLKEFPINTLTLFGKSFIYSGGGYFRIVPYILIEQWVRKSPYVMTYFHPRDFDPEQPVIPDLGLVRRFKSYVGLKNARLKLENWLQNFKFIDLSTAERQIEWSEVRHVKI